jgi:LPS-assembly lipoprotein
MWWCKLADMTRLPTLSTPSRPTRRLLLAASLAAITWGLSACGFALRQAPQMPFETIALVGFNSTSPMAGELAQALEASGVRVVEPPIAKPETHVILQALQDSRDQIVVSSTAYGQVREMGLRTRFTFRVLNAAGQELLPDTELGLSRELTYNEQDALAKDKEATELHSDMQTDIVMQTLRRLAAVRMR